MELGFHLLRRAGYDEDFISEVARVMEYQRAYELYREDFELADGRSASPSERHRMTVTAIWRYPVKSMAGERLARFRLMPNGTGGRSCRAGL